ncbi:MAG: class I tRNA ligase family protein [Saprospiraceae bacterium]
MNLNFNEIEKKWNAHWEKEDLYNVEMDISKPKFYVLDMFPYPSGAGLHVGHPLGYIASDIYARYKRMKGYNVLHPMGFDAFGLPAEEYAIETGIHPADSTEANIKRYCEQMKLLGFSFDWNRMIKTCDPKFYKWTQWIFTQLFEHYYNSFEDKAKSIDSLIKIFEKEGNTKVKARHENKNAFSANDWNLYSDKEKSEILMDYRLAYRKVGYVNWCEKLGTVLANDQVKDGISERGGHPVEKKAMTQWYLRITAYAERMITGLQTLEWSDALKTMQANWIGRSEGATILFDIINSDKTLEIYTTRPDTIYGATFMVLAPEHPYVAEQTNEHQKKEVEKYISYVNSRSEIERMAEKKVSGAFIGAYAYNPFTKKEIPIYISEYVLLDYGTGAIMAVPSDDDRDEAFAEKYNIDIIQVIDKSDFPGATLHDKVGKIINSDFLNGMEVIEAISAMCAKIEEMGIGEKKINYKLRDSNFSRQRYWGEPFPITFDSNNIAHVSDISELPVTLPHTHDFIPGKGGESPLSRIKDFLNPKEGIKRETDTMPAVAGSSWYHLRYMDPNNDEDLASAEKINYWQDVDLYVGGAEHAVAHLMYARFWHKFLFDLGKVPTQEPYKKLVNQGMIQGVIEYINLQKEKIDGVNRFVSIEIVNEEEKTQWVKIPVHVDFISDYGSENSYLDANGIKQFLDWRSAYKGNCSFESKKGIYNEKNLPNDFRLTTISEVGKMSKSKFNVINPDEVVEKYGADCFRMYEMFLGPIEQSKPWDTQGIDGVYKFLKRYISLFFKGENFLLSSEKATEEELKILHKTIKKVNHGIERFSFNTCVSAFMVCTNELKKIHSNKMEILSPLNILLAPFAPYITEELNSVMRGNSRSVHLEVYPTHNETYLQEEAFDYPICFNGKKRGMHSFPSSYSPKQIEAEVAKLEVFRKWTEGQTVRKVIVVPKRMVNIVVS